MGWNSSSTRISFNTGYQLDWVYTASPLPGRIQVNSARSRNLVYALSYTSSSYTFSSSKSYQYRILTTNVYATSASFSISPDLWQDRLYYSQIRGTTPSSVAESSTQSFFHYSSPASNVTGTKYFTINANGTFSSTGVASEGIIGATVTEIDFKMQGFAYYRLLGSELSPTETKNSLGWYYDVSQDIYAWYDRVSSPNILYDANGLILSTQSTAGLNPVGGLSGTKYAHFGYRLNNYLAKSVPYSYFNLSFYYENKSPFPMYLYIGTLPSYTPAQYNYELNGTGQFNVPGTLIATYTFSNGTQSYYYGLKGNQYLYFVGGYCGATASGATYCQVKLKNITVTGGYHPSNNRRYTFLDTGTYSYTNQISGATYTALVGSGNTYNAQSSLQVNQIFSKIGNGLFKAGIWENGVWNSGWRYDDSAYEFWEIPQTVLFNRGKRCRIRIDGSTYSTSKFKVGDIVSVGNIVSVDINEKRRVIKNSLTIVNKVVGANRGYLFLEFDSDFPVRRVKKDSDFHRILVTKNVWLSGAFLNGYFTGVWSYGLFKGYPLITEMFDTHWIDGVFDGGHFKSNKIEIPDFTNYIFTSGKVGLTFSQPHNLIEGDIIEVTKNMTSILPLKELLRAKQYDGLTKVTKVVNNYHIVIDKDWISDFSSAQSGKISFNKSKGVIQKIEFKSNNISTITSFKSIDSDTVFVYNSWLDLNYYDSSAVNIGKPNSINYSTNSLARDYSENNLYGYPTNDVLESVSSFRDSFSLSLRKYKLGTKYTIFDDYIGSAGEFNEYFGPNGTNTSQGRLLFGNLGWSYSTNTGGSLTFSRSMGVEYNASDITVVQTNDYSLYPDSLYLTDPGKFSQVSVPSVGFKGQELIVEAHSSGGTLELQTPYTVVDTTTDKLIIPNIQNRSTDDIQRFRYTIVEFDLLTYSVAEMDPKNAGIVGKKPANASDYYPKIHFNNLNYTGVSYQDPVFGAITYQSEATYLPIRQNINHLMTKGTKKIEYFFNKRNLSMNFRGNSPGAVSGIYSDTAGFLVYPSTIKFLIDSLKFYEVDMIPFFQYFTDNNINKAVQVPYQGLSPYIDYTDTGFKFIESISIGLDSIQTQNSYTPISGVGVGIGTANFNDEASNAFFNSETVGG